ncbi:MAG: redoxin domain-containing protein [Nitrospirae bacterium]|jgi:peroxiredoxin|nr:redoxin domain-containing protein [Nitrospirota bacterium]
MNKTLYFLISIFVLIFVSYSFAIQKTPAEGEQFPDISIKPPENKDDIDYLGIKEKKSFKLGQIKADIVIVEIFSMYCPYCQKEAPAVNELFNKIQEINNYKNHIKILGIGAGNTQFEVNLFKSQYDIKFPLVIDDDFKIHKAIGEVRTPYFFVVKINSDGSTKILYSKVGSIQEPSDFLNMIVNKAGL